MCKDEQHQVDVRLVILSEKCFETKDISYYANVCIQNKSILQGHLELAFSVLYII
jgi:hypothetical protein